MKQYLSMLLFGIVLTCGFSACSNDDDIQGGGRDTVAPARFVIQTNSLTRVTYDDILSSRFENGDVLGGFVLNAGDNSAVTDYTPNAMYRVVGEAEGAQALEAVLSQDAFPAGSTYKYVFYYPFKEGTAVKDMAFTVERDQSTEALYELSDLLWGVVEKGNDLQTPVTVEFDHAMANIVFRIESSRLDNSRTVKLLNVKTTITDFDMTTAMPSDPSGDNKLVGETVDKMNVTMLNCTNDEDAEWLTFRAAIPAQKFVNNTNMFTITTKNGDKTYKASFSQGDLTFLPGRYYLFTVTDDGLRFRGLIDDLTEGGDFYYEYEY